MGIVLARPESKHDKATRVNIPQATAAQGVARKRPLLANNSREQTDEANKNGEKRLFPEACAANWGKKEGNHRALVKRRLPGGDPGLH